jgi:hypothetical protein
MPKMQNVTEAEIKATVEKASDEFLMELFDYTNRLEKGYCDDLAKPADLARSLSNVAAAAARLATHILAKAAMQEDKAELQKLLAERARLKATT